MNGLTMLRRQIRRAIRQRLVVAFLLVTVAALLTNAQSRPRRTHSVGTVRDAAIQWQVKNGRQFIFTYPIVAETFDF